MVRTELREHIFKMLFQIEFNDSVDMPENLNYYLRRLKMQKKKTNSIYKINMKRFYHT